MDVNKPMIRFVRIAFSLLVVLIVVYIGVRLCVTSYDFGYRVFTEEAMDSGEGEDVLIQIKEGMSGYDIGAALEEKGLVRNARLFSIQLVLFEYADSMEPGVYTLSTSMSPKEIMVAIADAAEEAAEEAEGTTEETIEDTSDEGTTEIEVDE